MKMRSTEAREVVIHSLESIGVTNGDKLMVKVEPPFQVIPMMQKYSGDIVAIVGRYKDGDKLDSGIPRIVNVILPKPEGTWDFGPWEIIDICEVFDD